MTIRSRASRSAASVAPRRGRRRRACRVDGALDQVPVPVRPTRRSHARRHRRPPPPPCAATATASARRRRQREMDGVVGDIRSSTRPTNKCIDIATYRLTSPQHHPHQAILLASIDEALAGTLGRTSPRAAAARAAARSAGIGINPGSSTWSKPARHPWSSAYWCGLPRDHAHEGEGLRITSMKPAGGASWWLSPRFQQVIARLRDDEGCDAVVLGCTEIPLIMHDGNSPLPTLDPPARPCRRASGRGAAGTVGGDPGPRAASRGLARPFRLQSPGAAPPVGGHHEGAPGSVCFTHRRRQRALVIAAGFITSR